MTGTALVDLVVLDIAGTSVQEGGAVYLALREAVEAAGGRPDAGDLATWMGADKREAITALLCCGVPGTDVPPADRVETIYTDFRDRLLDAYRQRPPVPVTGVPETITTLRRHGVRVALTTGFSRDVTDPLLERLGWDDGFVDAVVTVEDVPAGRPMPYLVFRAMERTGTADVRRVLVAGDTTRDLEAGTNAGAGFVVGVLTGGHDHRTLGAQRHTHLLDSAARITELVLPADR